MVQLHLIHNGFTPGVNNGRDTIYAPPRFDPNGFFDLKSDSPAVDSGLTQFGRFPLDVDGKFRIVGDKVDLGAKEFPF